MPKFKITASKDFGRIKKGQSFIVVSWSILPLYFPFNKHIKQVLYLNGYRDEETLSKSSKGKWDAVTVDESDCLKELKEQEKAYKQARKQDDNSDGDDSNVEDNSCYTKFICTLILVLPIWWLIKLCIKCGISIFAIPWWIIKAICYVITWPIRAMLCCCLTEEQRRFLPKWTFNFWPAYSFKRF